MRPAFNWMVKPGSDRGFTLLELAITMTIIGLLTVSMVGLYTALNRRQKEVNTKTEMERIREAIEGYYQTNLILPLPDSGYRVPIDELDLPPGTQTDEIYAGRYYAYVATNQGSPFSELIVDGQSIGATSVVLISGGVDLRLEEENLDLADGEYTQTGANKAFDDLLLYIPAYELAASVTAQTQMDLGEISILNQAAEILAENDDDGDGLVDEDGTSGNCKKKDVTGNCDGETDWDLVTGVQSLTNAGLIINPDHTVDPWGNQYLWDPFKHRFYSAGPNGINEGCGGDDICP
jgi:prepilin-type N-terminal cleavage/methylation domain-containing protein